MQVYLWSAACKPAHELGATVTCDGCYRYTERSTNARRNHFLMRVVVDGGELLPRLNCADTRMLNCMQCSNRDCTEPPNGD
jgi:hypothetical protein